MWSIRILHYLEGMQLLDSGTLSVPFHGKLNSLNIFVKKHSVLSEYGDKTSAVACKKVQVLHNDTFRRFRVAAADRRIHLENLGPRPWCLCHHETEDYISARKLVHKFGPEVAPSTSDTK